MRSFPAILALGLFCTGAIADELRLDARQLFELGTPRNLRLSADGGQIELANGELIEDDGPAAGYSYKPNEELLRLGIQIKKDLFITNRRAKAATLLVAPGGDISSVINGKACKLEPQGKEGNYWQAYSFPPDLLVEGKNEFILSGTGKVWIARDDEFAAGSESRDRHPNRSAKSTDGGKTWNYDALGSKGDLDGEYYVRVFLDHPRQRGTLILPVIDGGNLAGRQIVSPSGHMPSLKIGMDCGPDKRGPRLRVRTGSTLAPRDETWSGWQYLDREEFSKPRGRFLQVAFEFNSPFDSETRSLKSLEIKTVFKHTSEWTNSLKVIESHNEKIVRSTVPFQYEPMGHSHLKLLREKYKLDDVVKGATGELDLATKLAAWSARQWENGHLSERYPAWNALEILAPHSDSKPVGGFCQQYNLVFLQACESFGLVGRCVSIGPGEFADTIRGGHEVVELWSNEHKKWVYIDGNAAWHFVDEKSKTPLSLWELRERQLQALAGKSSAPVQLVRSAETRLQWSGLSSWPPFVELRLIPRSNFLEQEFPLPLNQGMRGWFWTGHYAWTDEAAPAALLYGNLVSDRRNWDWTLNQARFLLTAAETPGTIQVHLETETPSFDSFIARFDDETAKPVSAEFPWILKPGKNRLEVWPRNKAGRDGLASWVVLEYKP